MPIKPDLSGVPETALWTLWFRAQAAKRGIFDDPLAVRVVEELDYPFAEQFGGNFPIHARAQAIRVCTFDRAIESFLAHHPNGTVAALGEGLETQFWRIGSPSVRWLTVDFKEQLALRAALLPAEAQMRTHPGSALDPTWMDEVDPAQGLCITAQGLLMYLQPREVNGLFSQLAARFPGATMLFDTVPAWMAGSIREGRLGFTPPPLPWTLEPGQLGTLSQYGDVQDLRPPRFSGFVGWAGSNLRYIPILRHRRPMILRLTFV